jgi:anti-anti-sigma factor
MLKITTNQEADSLVLKLEGAVKGPWVDELSKVWLGTTQQNRGEKILVDLQGVGFADSRGQALLLRMQKEGAAFIEPSAFLRFVLEQGARGGAD